MPPGHSPKITTLWTSPFYFDLGLILLWIQKGECIQSSYAEERIYLAQHAILCTFHLANLLGIINLLGWTPNPFQDRLTILPMLVTYLQTAVYHWNAQTYSSRRTFNVLESQVGSLPFHRLTMLRPSLKWQKVLCSLFWEGEGTVSLDPGVKTFAGNGMGDHFNVVIYTPTHVEDSCEVAESTR